MIFSLFCILVGSSLAPPPQINVSNYALNHFLVQSSAKKSLRSAKNVIFFLFCILVGRPMGMAVAPPPPPPPWLRYCPWAKNLFLEKMHNQSIVVLVDGQAAIKSLIKCTEASITVLNCIRKLKRKDCLRMKKSVGWTSSRLKYVSLTLRDLY